MQDVGNIGLCGVKLILGRAEKTILVLVEVQRTSKYVSHRVIVNCCDESSPRLADDSEANRVGELEVAVLVRPKMSNERSAHRR